MILGFVLSSGDSVVVQGGGGLTPLVPAAQVKVQCRLDGSQMRSATQLGLSRQKIVDIAAYLKQARE
jgi:hypothetical protein